ncbi:tetratricopeptide repeat protein [Candidatus Bipolaricaulota bacterium]
MDRALRIFCDAGIVDGQAVSLKSLGVISTRLGELPQAMERFEAARALYRQIGDRKGEADILGNLGALSYYLGDYEATIRYTEQAQPMFEDMGNRSGSAACLGNLGSSYSALGAFEEALRHHERGLAIYRQLEAASDCADSYSDMGTDHHALGVGGYPELSATIHEENDDLRTAIRCHTEALSIRERIGSKGGEVVSHYNLGSIYSSLGDAGRAEMHLQQALEVGQNLGLDAAAMRALAALARVSLHTGDAKTALARSAEAVDQLGDQALPDADEIHFTQYQVLMAAGQVEAAQRHLKLATDSILSKSQAIADADLRTKFLDMYHEVLTAWSNRRATSSG